MTKDLTLQELEEIKAYLFKMHFGYPIDLNETTLTVALNTTSPTIFSLFLELVQWTIENMVVNGKLSFSIFRIRKLMLWSVKIIELLVKIHHNLIKKKKNG